MSSADWIIKQGDTAPVLTDTLTLKDGSVPNFAGATLQFVMRNLVSAQVTPITGTASFTDIATGAVEFDPSASDTSVAGNLMGSWVVQLANGKQMTWPTQGWLWIEIEPSLGAVPQQLISLPDLKMQMDVPADDRIVDLKLLRLLEASRALIENIVGPVIPQQFEEWHDGGQVFIRLRRRPSSAMGTSPTTTLIACSEYIGPIEWPLAVVASPDLGQMYSCMLDARLGRVVRRTAGGGVQAFPYGPQSVHVVYMAGQQSVPWNVYEATLEAVRSNYMTTQPVGGGFASEADQEDASQRLPFFMPRVALELLAPMRRHPSLA